MFTGVVPSGGGDTSPLLPQKSLRKKRTMRGLALRGPEDSQISPMGPRTKASPIRTSPLHARGSPALSGGGRLPPSPSTFGVFGQVEALAAPDATRTKRTRRVDSWKRQLRNTPNSAFIGQCAQAKKTDLSPASSPQPPERRGSAPYRGGWRARMSGPATGSLPPQPPPGSLPQSPTHAMPPAGSILGSPVLFGGATPDTGFVLPTPATTILQPAGRMSIFSGGPRSPAASIIASPRSFISPYRGVRRKASSARYRGPGNFRKESRSSLVPAPPPPPPPPHPTERLWRAEDIPAVDEWSVNSRQPRAAIAAAQRKHQLSAHLAAQADTDALEGDVVALLKAASAAAVVARRVRSPETLEAIDDEPAQWSESVEAGGTDSYRHRAESPASPAGEIDRPAKPVERAPLEWHTEWPWQATPTPPLMTKPTTALALAAQKAVPTAPPAQPPQQEAPAAASGDAAAAPRVTAANMTSHSGYLSITAAHRNHQLMPHIEHYNDNDVGSWSDTPPAGQQQVGVKRTPKQPADFDGLRSLSALRIQMDNAMLGMSTGTLASSGAVGCTMRAQGQRRIDFTALARKVNKAAAAVVVAGGAQEDPTPSRPTTAAALKHKGVKDTNEVVQEPAGDGDAGGLVAIPEEGEWVDKKLIDALPLSRQRSAMRQLVDDRIALMRTCPEKSKALKDACDDARRELRAGANFLENNRACLERYLPAARRQRVRARAVARRARAAAAVRKAMRHRGEHAGDGDDAAALTSRSPKMLRQKRRDTWSQIVLLAQSCIHFRIRWIQLRKDRDLQRRLQDQSQQGALTTILTQFVPLMRAHFVRKRERAVALIYKFLDDRRMSRTTHATIMTLKKNITTVQRLYRMWLRRRMGRRILWTKQWLMQEDVLREAEKERLRRRNEKDKEAAAAAGMTVRAFQQQQQQRTIIQVHQANERDREVALTRLGVEADAQYSVALNLYRHELHMYLDEMKHYAMSVDALPVEMRHMVRRPVAPKKPRRPLLLSQKTLARAVTEVHADMHAEEEARARAALDRDSPQASPSPLLRVASVRQAKVVSAQRLAAGGVGVGAGSAGASRHTSFYSSQS